MAFKKAIRPASLPAGGLEELEASESAPKLVKVKVISRHLGRVLVEYVSAMAHYSRHWVAEEAITVDSEIAESDLADSPAYGDDFTGIVQCTTSPEEIINQLHRRGIYTYTDAARDIGAVRASFLHGAETDIGAFLTGISQNLNKHK